MAAIQQPKYDNDIVTLGYLNKVINMQQEETKESFSKNFNSPPNPPYYIGWTYTTSDKIYKCVKNRLIGSFTLSDWVVIYNKKQNELLTDNILFLSEIDIKEQPDGKIETFYQNDDPSLEWDTNLKKSEHIGDYWRGQVDGVYYTYIYTKIASNPVSYDWLHIDVPLSIFDTVNGHKNIYTDIPTSYSKNDYLRVMNQEMANILNLNIGDYAYALNDNDSFYESDWLKKDDELSLKSMTSYYYTTEEISKIVQTINNTIAADILRTENSIKLYAEQKYTTVETTEELTRKVDANGSTLEEIKGVNTTEIPTKTLAQLSILLDGINSTVSTKVGANEIISKINQSAEAIKILARNIQLEGLITANGNFKVLSDGSIEAVNASLKGNIYLPNGGKIIGGDGMLTNLQFVGVSKTASKSVSGDFGFLGFDSPIGIENGQDQRNSMIFDVYIPQGFTIVEAKLFLFHAPVKFGYYNENNNLVEEWGYSRNLRLYKTNTNNFYRHAVLLSAYNESDQSTLTEISGTLGNNGYTPSAPSNSNHKVEIKESGNFKNQLSSGLNRLVIKTANNVPNAILANGIGVEAARQTGCVQAFINVIGYLNYEGV